MLAYFPERMSGGRKIFDSHFHIFDLAVRDNFPDQGYSFILSFIHLFILPATSISVTWQLGIIFQHRDMHSFIHLFNYSFIHSFIHSLIHSCMHSFLKSLTCLFLKILRHILEPGIFIHSLSKSFNECNY